MNLLIVTPRFPYPASTADRLTVFQLLKHFSQRHTIDLVACSSAPVAREHTDAVAPFCRSIHTLRVAPLRSFINTIGAVLRRQPIQPAWFYTAGVTHIIEQLIQRDDYEVLYAHTIRAARFLTDLEPQPHTLCVLAMQISMRLNYQRLADCERNFVYRMVFKYEADRLRSYESYLSEQFDRSLVISDVDRTAISDRPSARFFECPHGVFLDNEPPGSVERDPNMIVFSGRMDYRPNVDAALFFCQEIFPRVRASVQDAVFFIVGANPDASVRNLERIDGVTVTGEVDAIYPWLRRAAVGIDPLRAGAGLQNKVLEGLACGLPLVVTSIANEGIKAEPDVHLLTADSASAFADQVIRLLEDEALRGKLSTAGRRFIEEHWTWEVHFNRLERMFEEESRAKRASGARNGSRSGMSGRFHGNP